MTTKAERQQAESQREDALLRLRAILKPGDTVYCVLRNRSASGMTRRISVFALDKQDAKTRTAGWFIHDISFDASKVLRERINHDDGGLIISGCGMDMGFHVVYELGRRLFPEGFGEEGQLLRKSTAKQRMDPAYNTDPIDTRRPATPAEAKAMVGAGYEFRGRNGDRSGWDTDGGYALRRVWL
jgi:hypothetical protein